MAQHALKHSGELFSQAFHMAPGPNAILPLDGLRVIDVNTAFTAATGWRHEEVVDRGEAELALWGDDECRRRVERLLKERGHVRGVDVQLRGKNGAAGDFLMSAETVEINGAPCVLSFMVDNTERKQTETELLAAVDSVMQDATWLGRQIVEQTNSTASRTTHYERASKRVVHLLPTNSNAPLPFGEQEAPHEPPRLR